jgi:heat shock protein HslJ
MSMTAFARPDMLGSSQWELTHLNGRNVRDSKAFLEINPGRERFAGNAGCNQVFGGVEVTRNRIDFRNIGSTRKTCGGNGGIRFENEFIRTLDRVTRYEQRGRNLHLYQGNRIVLKLKEMHGRPTEPQRIQLEDRKWMLESIKGKSIGRQKEAAFINFDGQKMSAGGNTSCNVFGGSYSAKGETIRIFDTISTMRACIEDDRMKIERGFMNGLERANRFDIEGEKLYLYRNSELLLEFKGTAK